MNATTLTQRLSDISKMDVQNLSWAIKMETAIAGQLSLETTSAPSQQSSTHVAGTLATKAAIAECRSRDKQRQLPSEMALLRNSLL